MLPPVREIGVTDEEDSLYPVIFQVLYDMTIPRTM